MTFATALIRFNQLNQTDATKVLCLFAGLCSEDAVTKIQDLFVRAVEIAASADR